MNQTIFHSHSIRTYDTFLNGMIPHSLYHQNVRPKAFTNRLRLTTEMKQDINEICVVTNINNFFSCVMSVTFAGITS